MNLAIIGASGNVGRKTIEILENSKLSFDKLFLVASSNSAGKKLIFKGKEIEIENLNNYDFSKAHITFFAAGSQISKEWAPKAAKQTIVIDKDLFEITDISWDSLGVSAFESFIYDNAMQVSISNFTSPGYKSGLRNGMNVLSVEKVEKRITKHWFYIPGLILYLLVFLNQKYNRKKDII